MCQFSFIFLPSHSLIRFTLEYCKCDQILVKLVKVSENNVLSQTRKIQGILDYSRYLFISFESYSTRMIEVI